MGFSRNAFRALGLCFVAALGLLAAMASAAQAETGAQWMVGNSNTFSSKLVEAKLEALPGKPTEVHGVLFTEVGKTPVEILCEKIEFDDGLIKEGPTATATSLLFFGCITKLKGETSAPCKPTGGEIHTNAVIALLKLHKLESGEVDKLVLVAPAEGTTFVRVKFESPTCTIELEEGSGMPITGEAWLKDCNNAIETEAISHLVEEVHTSLGHLTFGTAGHEANIKGSASLQLTSANTNWSGLLK